MTWITQLLSYWSRQVFAPGTLLRKKYQYFRDLLVQDRHCLELMAEIEEIHYRNLPCDYARLERLCRDLARNVGTLIKSLIALNPLQYRILKESHQNVVSHLNTALACDPPRTESPYALSLNQTLGTDLAGGKAANLSLIKRNGYPVPEGFCITTRAFHLFITESRLRSRITQQLSHICLDRIDALETICRDVQTLILEAPVPEAVQNEVAPMLEALQTGRLAFRSSACGEDGALSFAGQYQSILNVAPSDWHQAYKQVLAGKYSPRAIAYRIHAGMPDELLPMAVLVLEMVEAKESGLVYSSGIDNPDVTGVYMVSGLSDQLVSGRIKAREIFIPKNKPYDFAHAKPAYLQQLVEQAAQLEAFFEKPQDIEWVLGPRDQLMFLQTRPLQAIKPDNDASGLDLPVLARGAWASPGLGSGKVYILESRKDISKIPKGAIVVARGLYPELTAGLGNLSGVIATAGSAASHFATIAREQGVPVVINVAQTESLFTPGMPVTLDGNRGLVHDGRAESRKLYAPRKKSWLAERMKTILAHVSTLHLKDAEAATFTPENCRSMHDLIRYTHEMAVREMFALAGRKGRGLSRSKTLALDIPLAFRVLNLENGVTAESDDQDPITLAHITCKPFQALFVGLQHPAIEWDMNIQHFDWEQFDKLSGGVFDPTKSPLLSSYGLLAADYMHVLIRFGYHFAVVDALLTTTPEQNYVQFSFKGGGAEDSQKLMRLETIRIVLDRLGFDLELRGDLLNANYSRESAHDTEKRLAAIGYILGNTRLMDMRMHEDIIEQTAQTFWGDIHAVLAL